MTNSDPSEDRGVVLARIKDEIDHALTTDAILDPSRWFPLLPDCEDEIRTLVELRTFAHGESAKAVPETAEENILAEIEAEFQNALNQGVEPDPVRWQARYPHLASEIERMVGTQDFLQDALEGAPLAGMPRNGGDESETALGRYRILHRIADHPVGTAYLGVADDPPQRVELLVLDPGIPKDVGWQILREADQTRALQGKGLLPAIDVGEVRGVRFIAARHEDGVTLSQALLDLAFHGGERSLDQVLPPRGRPVGDEEREEDLAEARSHASLAAEVLGQDGSYLVRALRLVASIGRVVALAHLEGRLHRNLSPAAVVVGRDGHPHLRWFGLTRYLPPPTPGTTPVPVWRSPELVIPGEHHVDWRTDVWGVGALLFGLVRFEAPLVLAPGDGALERLASEGPARLESDLAQITPLVRVPLARALAWNAEARQPTCDALAEELEEVARTLEKNPLGAAGATRRGWWRRLLGG